VPQSPDNEDALVMATLLGWIALPFEWIDEDAVRVDYEGYH
jgi:hypothetical protein